MPVGLSRYTINNHYTYTIARYRKASGNKAIAPLTRQIPSSSFCEKEPIYLLCNLFSLQCMLRALLIFVLGTKYTHPFSETQGLGFPRAGWGWAPGLRDHTKGALCLLAHPHVPALQSGFAFRVPRPRPCSALPASCARPSSSAGSRKTRSEPARAAAHAQSRAGSAC